MVRAWASSLSIPSVPSVSFEEATEGSIMMDGNEQILIEKTDDKISEVSGIVNLSPMESGDTIIIREYMQTISTGNYALYKEETYSGIQKEPLIQVKTRISTHDVKVTIQQTSGTYKTFEYSFTRFPKHI